MSEEGKLYVGGLNYNTNDDALNSAMRGFGSIMEAKVVLDKFTGRSRGFGFVVYHNPDDARAAIDEMNGTELDGRNITVSYARKESSSRDGGSYSSRRSDSGSDPYKLYIGGLNENTDEFVLEKEASRYGKVEDGMCFLIFLWKLCASAAEITFLIKVSFSRHLFPNDFHDFWIYDLNCHNLHNIARQYYNMTSQDSPVVPHMLLLNLTTCAPTVFDMTNVYYGTTAK